jgi:hypothetical protein
VRNSTKKYAAIGYVVSKFVLPLAKQQAKRAAKAKAKGAAAGVGGAVRRSPGRTSLIVGSAIGAVGWLVTRHRDRDDDQA